MKKIKLRAKQIVVLIKYMYYRAYCKILHINNNSIWLLSERGDEARDNSLFFYQYLKKEHPEIQTKFVLAKDSKDISKIRKEDLVILGSKEHYILFITAKYHISTHIMGCSPEFRLFCKLDKNGLIKIPAKKIFINHGIDKDKPDGYDKFHLDIFVAGAQPQYYDVVKNYGQDPNKIKYTGLPRYDNLVNFSTKKQILFMPTWRKELFYCKSLEAFKASNYYKMWSELMRSPELNDILEQHNLQLFFYPHYEIQPYIDAFKPASSRIIICKSNKYDVQTLLKESELLVTDYSSIFFDFTYMKKPLIYYHFDYHEYRTKHYKQGYFHYARDGFGPIALNPNDVIKGIKTYIKNDFKVEKSYLSNRDRFFTLEPCRNCERLFHEIQSL